MTSQQYCIPTISANLEERFPRILPATTDYGYVNTIFLHHLQPSDHYFRYDHDVERTTAATSTTGVGVYNETTAATTTDVDAVFSSLGDDKAGGTLQSIVDQATRLGSTNVSSTIYHDGDKMINDDMSTWLANTPQSITNNTSVDITTTMAVDSTLLLPSKNHHHDHHQRFMQVTDSSSVVITSDTHETPKIKQYYRNGKEEKNEIYATNEVADYGHMDNYMVSSKCKDGLMKSVVDDQDNPSGTSDLLNNSISRPSPMREGRKKAEKCNTISSSVKRSKATILHNKAEHKRRNKINQRMETLQKLVPNICRKTDKATILDQVIEYIKKLQNQRDHMIMMRSYEMINNMMIPMPYYTIIQQQQEEQQLQMSMMAGAQMGMCLDLCLLNMHPNMNTTETGTTPAIVHPTFLVPPPNNHSTILIPPSNNHS